MIQTVLGTCKLVSLYKLIFVMIAYALSLKTLNRGLTMCFTGVLRLKSS